MAQTYLLFDFGSDEEKAQQARHKLEGWKQAFRLDKKLLYKLDRGESDGAASAEHSASSEPPAAPSKSSKASKSAKSSQPTAKSKTKPRSESSEKPAAAGPDGPVNLAVRLYFSGHEKLTEQRMLDRIPNEEPFKDASPRVVRQGEPQFDELVQEFESLE